MNQPSSIVSDLRVWMTKQTVDALIIPTTDPHQSEYTPARFSSRAFVSGFRGSAGTVVVTHDHAGLWTDSRYFLEAESALAGSEFVLHRLHTEGSADFPEWLASSLRAGQRVGVDARLVTLSHQRTMDALFSRAGIELTAVSEPMEQLWRDRPELPSEPVWVLEDSLSGESAAKKLHRLRGTMQRVGARSHVITTLDDIAWLFNLRGSDVAFNPVFLAYAIVTDADLTLYTDAARLTSEASEALKKIDCAVRPYNAFESDIGAVAGPVLIDPERVSWATTAAMNGVERVEKMQPTTAMKAQKNTIELANLRQAMVRDGRAMVRFLAWIDDAVAAGDKLDELTAAERLRRFRCEDASYVSDSFNYISGFDANGAIIHYALDPASPAPFDTNGVYLIDSGAQYRDGTTDITRTVAVGAPDQAVIDDFSLVLKGHIALARLIFPRLTTGAAVDTIARQHLWAHRRNYGHGTGHGVGYVLNVHEGPQKIAPQAPPWPLEVGMIVSNEPGLYRVGKYGIRIENLLAVTDAGESEFGRFLAFETLTLCPIDRRLIKADALDDVERAWLNDYHARVRDALSEGLEARDRAWLDEATRPI